MLGRFDVLDFQRWQAAQKYTRQRLARSVLARSIDSLHPSVPDTLVAIPRVLEATPEPCPWLHLAHCGLSLPYFLWDKDRGCAQATSELEERPQYIAISHTWGRWRKEGNGTKVHGVPWLVLENRQFDVRDLPNILRRSPFPIKYLWIDLLCIPQDFSDPSLNSITKQEVACQAKIFAGAVLAL